jgi:hypothetical protein
VKQLFQQPTFSGGATLTLVIPSAAEGAAVRLSPKQLFPQRKPPLSVARQPFLAIRAAGSKP